MDARAKNVQSDVSIAVSCQIVCMSRTDYYRPKLSNDSVIDKYSHEVKGIDISAGIALTH